MRDLQAVPRPSPERCGGCDKSPSNSASHELALVWAGMLLGVSFVATPAKFLAPSLSRPAALDVGRHTFRVFGLVEMALAATALGLRRPGPRARLLAFAPGAIVLAQGLWLRPRLAPRTRHVIAGHKLPSSWLHAAYVAGEVAKLAALLAAGVAARPHPPHKGAQHG